jgi:hypothetical protein
MKHQYISLLMLILISFVLDSVNATDFIPNSVCYHGEPGIDFDNPDDVQSVNILLGSSAPASINYFLFEKKNTDHNGYKVFYDQDSPSLDVIYCNDFFTKNIVKTAEISSSFQIVYHLSLYLRNQSLLI